MFCIAAFIVFCILAVFSASYRPLVGQAWHCVVRRVTFKPCDINFAEEVKGRLIGKLIVRRPGLARFLNTYLDWLSFIFVILSVWSLVYVANAGLNLWVYDTCDPSKAESCSLSGEACGIDQAKLGLVQAVEDGRLVEWAAGPFLRFGETVSRIPDRLSQWNAKEYLVPTATFYYPEDPSKPYSLEIIDPSCIFCKKLTGNLHEAGVFDRENVSYILYPIPNGTGGYKFPRSYLMATYIEATKDVTPSNGDRSVAPDWQLLMKIFTAQSEETVDLQMQFVMGFNQGEAVQALQNLLREIGYTPEEVRQVEALAGSQSTRDRLAAQAVIVTERIRTIKIPTLLIDGRRYDRVVGPEKLR